MYQIVHKNRVKDKKLIVPVCFSFKVFVEDGKSPVLRGHQTKGRAALIVFLNRGDLNVHTGS